MPVKTTDQPGLFDRTLEMPELEEHLERWLETKEAAKQHADANRKIKTIAETLAIQDGERVRVGGYVITGKARNGGGFEVPTWEKVTVGAVADVTA